jgi:ABC-2 type transport system ATP-binding protein
MIEVKNAVKLFEGYKALDGLDMTVPKGSVYGLVGPNGAGKTTVIKHLAGIYRQDEGQISIAGEPVYENPKVKAKIAYVPDEIYFFPTASIKDMQKFYKGLYPGFDMDRYIRLSSAFELSDKTQLRRFSRGMQKQAAFWLALSMRPELLILDEPVDGLDPVMRRQLWSLILGDVAEYGTTVLVSSHNLRELEDVCDYVGIMNKGKMMIERSLSQLQENLIKVQLAYDSNHRLPDNLSILHESRTGQVMTLIVRGNTAEVSSKITASSPLFFDVLPLTLEEIFIYELGGADYAVKDIIL